MHFNKCHISFGFATLLPERRLALNLEKIHIFVWHSSQNCPQSQHSLLAHTILPYEVANCVIRELDNIIVERQDPHS